MIVEYTPVFFYLSLLKFALWKEPAKGIPDSLTNGLYAALHRLSDEQATLGLTSHALANCLVRLPQENVLDLLSTEQSIKVLNARMDGVLVDFCKMMQVQGIRILVVKGQTLARLYPIPDLRQCGDIDFICHPDDLAKAVRFLKGDLGLQLSHSGSNKHAAFTWQGVCFEIHNMLTNFAYPPSHRYWERVFMKAVWAHPYTVDICDYPVPTLAPTYNAVYVFEHIFFHLIMDGIGFRQFCDWALVLHHHRAVINREELLQHLEGIRLEDAYKGLGALLTDRLGLPVADFPLQLEGKHHRRVEGLLQNLFQYGNFGHNIGYRSAGGPIHAIEHLMRIGGQAFRFFPYAPAEVLWRIPYMIKWWMTRIVRAVVPCKSLQSVFERY